MIRIFKQKQKRAEALFVALFFAFLMSIFFAHDAKAAADPCVAKYNELTAAKKNDEAIFYYEKKSCQCTDKNGKVLPFKDFKDSCVSTDSDHAGATECMNQCKKEYPDYDDGELFSKINNIGSSLGTVAQGGVQDNSEPAKELKCASSIKDGVGAYFECVLKAMLFGVLQLFGWLFSIAATLFAWVVDAKNISGEGGVLNYDAIKDVWVMVRDTLNMAFILVLLFAAFCTVFQVDKWNLKKVWLNILINALLVNFSFPIARFFIDVSNVAMYYFLSHLFVGDGASNGSSIMAMFGTSSGIAKLLIPGDFAKADWSYIIAAIVFTFILGMTLLVLAAMFVIRLIALAMIIMFSPVGFVGYIFPSTSSYADDWWSNLFKYSFFGPIMVFIMAIAVKIMEAAEKQGFANFTKHAVTNTASGASVDANWIASAAFYTIPIIILWMGMGIAQKMGIAGAGMVVGNAEKFSKWAGNTFSGLRGAKWMATKAAPVVAKAGMKKFERDVLAKRGLSPRAFIEAWNARTKSDEENKIGVATGAWRDRLNKMWSGGKDKTHFEEAAFQANVLKKAKEVGDVSQESEYLMSEYRNAMDKGDKKTMAAMLRLMFSNNDQNEFMKLNKDEEHPNGRSVDPFAMRELIYSQLTKKGGMKDHEAAKVLSDLSEIAVSKGNYANYGMAAMNTDTGKFEISDNKNQKNACVAKASNVKAQSKADSWHWNSFLVENPPGHHEEKVGGLHEIGKAQLLNLTAGELDQLNRARPDFIQNLSSKKAMEDMIKLANSPGVKTEQREMILSFIANIQSIKNKPKIKSEEKTNAG